MGVEFQRQPKEEGIAGDRRSDRRYDLELDVRWKLIRRKRVLETGTGRSVDLSSGGILFEADHPLPEGLNVELSVSWPVMLHNVAAMQLVVSGRIVRTSGNRVGVHMTQHDFRTMGVPADRKNVMAMGSRAPVGLPTSSSKRYRRAN
jgi:hypothetical protein